MNDALESVIAMRRDNEDVFPTPEPLRTMWFVNEECQEFWRVWEKELGSPYLRGNDMHDVDLQLKKQLEWGQAAMMLLTAAYQANINPDLALHMAIEVAYERSSKRRMELDDNKGE